MMRPSSILLSLMSRSESVNHWNDYKGLEQTKHFFPLPDEKWARRVEEVVTEHCCLNKRLAKMELSQDPYCTYDLEKNCHIYFFCRLIVD